MVPPVSSSISLGFFLRRRSIGALLRFSTAVVEKNPSPPKPHFMVEYLVASCGFSSAMASEASKPLSHLKSTQKPDSFVGFMRSQGFNDTQLRKIISCRPKLMCFDVEKTLKPKFQSLRDLGFSESDLIHLVNSSPDFLKSSFHRTVLPRINFWEGILGSRDHLMKLVMSNWTPWFFFKNIEKLVMPNIALLREWGISDQRIASVLMRNPRIIVKRPEAFRKLVGQVERLGISHSSGIFMLALNAVYQVSATKLNDNLQLMRSLGWSEAEFISAFQRCPKFLISSSKMLSQKMNFLVKEVGCKPAEVARHPILLNFSLETRLIPRHRVICTLKSKGFLKQHYKIRTIMSYSDMVFMKTFVIPYKEKVPQLQEMFSSRSCS